MQHANGQRKGSCCSMETEQLVALQAGSPSETAPAKVMTAETSQSGVNKEIRLFARPMAISGMLGIALIVGRAVL